MVRLRGVNIVPVKQKGALLTEKGWMNGWYIWLVVLPLLLNVLVAQSSLFWLVRNYKPFKLVLDIECGGGTPISMQWPL